MWLFTKYGFFSAVCARRGHGGYDQPVDPERIMIRSRAKPHLEALQQRFPCLAAPIVSFPGSDYPFRIFVPKTTWAETLSHLAIEMNYDNFKSAVARSTHDPAYEQSLHDVWETMRTLEGP